VTIPVVGGHAGITILPLLSQCRPPLQLDAGRAQQLMARIQVGGGAPLVPRRWWRDLKSIKHS